MLKHRLISFVILLTILWVIATQSCGLLVFAAMAAFLTGMAVFEGVRLAEKLGIPGFPRLAGAAAALATLAVVCRIPTRAMVFVPAVILLLTVAVWVAILCRRDGAFRKLVCSIGLALPMWISFSAVFLTVHRGLATVVFLICCTKAMDPGGYIAGMLSARLLPGGNHKIAPSISPKKSWEGFCGGLLLSLAAGWMFYRYQVLPEKSLAFILTAAGVLSVGSFFGDLTESALKRAADIKDSGSWLPGMGGALDLLDSFIYNGILFFILTMLFRL